MPVIGLSTTSLSLITAVSKPEARSSHWEGRWIRGDIFPAFVARRRHPAPGRPARLCRERCGSGRRRHRGVRRSRGHSWRFRRTGRCDIQPADRSLAATIRICRLWQEDRACCASCAASIRSSCNSGFHFPAVSLSSDSVSTCPATWSCTSASAASAACCSSMLPVSRNLRICGVALGSLASEQMAASLNCGSEIGKADLHCFFQLRIVAIGQRARVLRP